jgi:uncharacterized protein
MADAAGLERLIAATGGEGPSRPLPPVHLWNPTHCGDIDIVIRKDGSWWHEGSPIGRAPLVRLFSTVLRKDPDGFVLVTPVEKLKIVVEDAPFVAISADREGDALVFTTNVGDRAAAGPDHSIRVETDPASGAPRPYVHVRAGLEALIARSVFYRLVETAEPRDGRLGLVSKGVWFDLGEAA